MAKKLGALALAIFALIALWLINATPVFIDKAKSLEVYTDLSSSGRIVKGEFWWSQTRIKGESFKAEEDFDLGKFLKDYDGEILFTEEIDEGVSYYCYSKKMKYQKIVYGQAVNLHIFVGKNQVTVGSPIIFGSF